jgi:hypothetical protein
MEARRIAQQFSRTAIDGCRATRMFQCCSTTRVNMLAPFVRGERKPATGIADGLYLSDEDDILTGMPINCLNVTELLE